MKKIVVISVATTVVAAILLPWSFSGLGLRHRFASLLEPHAHSAPRLCHELISSDLAREFTIDYFTLRFSGVTTSAIDRHILCYGAWEPGLLFFLHDASERLGTDGAVFVDVGAHTGTHVLYMSQFVSKVHAFEPYPPILTRLYKNLEQNQIENVTVHEVGLGDRMEEVAFEEPEDTNPGQGSFVTGLGGGNIDRGLSLKVVKGDDYFHENGIEKVDWLKIDVEGSEKAVLKGLSGAISKNRPIISVEVTSKKDVPELFTSEREILEALPAGYRLFELENAQIANYHLVPLRFEERGRSDVVAIPEEHVDEVLNAGSGR